jgi:hypothetical protein
MDRTFYIMSGHFKTILDIPTEMTELGTVLTVVVPQFSVEHQTTQQANKRKGKLCELRYPKDAFVRTY